MPGYLAYCGSRCDLCPRYEATIVDDLDRLADLAELWYRCGWRDEILPPEEMKCTGCYSTKWCRYDISTCANACGVANCGDCEVYDSCATLKDMFDRNYAYMLHCKTVCSPEEFEMLRKTCFNKKANLTAIRPKTKKKSESHE